MLGLGLFDRRKPVEQIDEALVGPPGKRRFGTTGTCAVCNGKGYLPRPGSHVHDPCAHCLEIGTRYVPGEEPVLAVEIRPCTCKAHKSGVTYYELLLPDGSRLNIATDGTPLPLKCECYTAFPPRS